MDISTMILYLLAGLFLVVSFIKDKQKTRQGIQKGVKAFKNIVPLLIPLFMIVGILLAFITPDMIKNLLGDDTGWIGNFLGLLMGSIAFMPPFVAYPLGAELLAKGAGISQVAAFVTSLMGVGIVYFSAEIKFFGTASTIGRNILALSAAVLVSIAVGVFI